MVWWRRSFFEAEFGGGFEHKKIFMHNQVENGGGSWRRRHLWRLLKKAFIWSEATFIRLRQSSNRDTIPSTREIE
jgi:hypothetical protein